MLTPLSASSARSIPTPDMYPAPGGSFYDSFLQLEAAYDWTRGQNYLSLPLVAGNDAHTPNSAALQIAGDIDIRALIAPATWTPTGLNYYALVSKQSAGVIEYQFTLMPAGDNPGKLRLDWMKLGVIKTAQSTVVTGFSNNFKSWVRVTLDVDNGSGGSDCKFWTSTDGVTWSQLGVTVTTAGVTSLDTGTTQVEVGGRNSGANDYGQGPIYYADIRNTLANDGTGIVANFDANQASHAAASWVSSTGETWTVNTSGGTPAKLIGAPDTANLLQLENAAGLRMENNLSAA